MAESTGCGRQDSHRDLSAQKAPNYILPFEDVSKKKGMITHKSKVSEGLREKRQFSTNQSM